MAKNKSAQPTHVEPLLEEASFRCHTVHQSWQRDPWIPVLEKTLFDKVYCITGGGGWMSLDGERYKLAPGRTFLFPAGTIQRGAGDKRRGGLKVLWTHFQAHTAGTLQILRLLPVPRCLTGATSQRITQMMEEMLEEFASSRTAWPLAIKSLLPRILLTACRAPKRDVCPPDDHIEEPAAARAVSGHHVDVVARATQRITSHFADKLSLGQLATGAHLSAPYFNQLFRRLVGMPPMKFLERCRIRRAQEMLSATQSTVSEVAAAVGYTDPAHFTRAFKRVVNASPSAYRDAARRSAGAAYPGADQLPPS